MSADEGPGAALFREPLPEGFSKHRFWAAPGVELGLRPGSLPAAIVVVERGRLELECRAGARRCFGRGSMIPISRLPIAHARSVGPGPLVLVAVWRASLPAGGDEFLGDPGSYSDC